MRGEGSFDFSLKMIYLSGYLVIMPDANGKRGLWEAMSVL